jgi:hypothetical protein
MVGVGLELLDLLIQVLDLLTNDLFHLSMVGVGLELLTLYNDEALIEALNDFHEFFSGDIVLLHDLKNHLQIIFRPLVNPTDKLGNIFQLLLSL